MSEGVLGDSTQEKTSGDIHDQCAVGKLGACALLVVGGMAVGCLGVLVAATLTES